MKLQLDTKKFCDAVQMVSAVVPARSTKPILSNLRINASKDDVELLATDLEVGIRCSVAGVTVRESGSAVVPAAELLSILRETPDDAIEMHMEDTRCEISGADSNYSLPGADPAEFPEVPEFKDGSFIELKVPLLSEMIRKTAFATAKEKTRYALNGVLLVLREDSVEMVATDARRLAHIKKRSKSAKGTEHEIIVPRKAVDELERIISGGDKTVRLSVLENQVIFNTGGVTLCSRLVDGHFPDYQSVLPTGNDKKLDLAVAPLLSAVRRAALVTSDDSQSIRLQLEKGKLTVVARSVERGEARIQLKTDYDGNKMEISFNPDFFVDVLRVLTEEKISLELKDGDRPGLLRAGKDYQYVLMPVTAAQSA